MCVPNGERVFSLLKLWIEKYWYDFWKDCPQLSDETLSWLGSIVNDPAAGGGPNVAPEALTNTAKVANSLKEKLLQYLQNPHLLTRLTVPVCSFLVQLKLSHRTLSQVKLKLRTSEL